MIGIAAALAGTTILNNLVGTVKDSLEIYAKVSELAAKNDNTPEGKALQEELDAQLKALQGKMTELENLTKEVPNFPPQTQILIPNTVLLYFDGEVGSDDAKEIESALRECEIVREYCGGDVECADNFVALNMPCGESGDMDVLPERLVPSVTELLREEFDLQVRAVSYY